MIEIDHAAIADHYQRTEDVADLNPALADVEGLRADLKEALNQGRKNLLPLFFPNDDGLPSLYINETEPARRERMADIMSGVIQLNLLNKLNRVQLENMDILKVALATGSVPEVNGVQTKIETILPGVKEEVALTITGMFNGVLGIKSIQKSS